MTYLEKKQKRIVKLLEKLHSEMSDFIVAVNDNAGAIGDPRIMNNINDFNQTFDKFLETSRAIRNSMHPAINNPHGIGNSTATPTEMK